MIVSGLVPPDLSNPFVKAMLDLSFFHTEILKHKNYQNAKVTDEAGNTKSEQTPEQIQAAQVEIDKLKASLNLTIDNLKNNTDKI